MQGEDRAGRPEYERVPDFDDVADVDFGAVSRRERLHNRVAIPTGLRRPRPGVYW